MTMTDDQRRYKLILTGRLLPGKTLAETTRAIADLYGTDQERVAQTFAQTPRILRRDVSLRKAERYRRALQRCGAEVVIVPAGQGRPKPSACPAPDSAAWRPTNGDDAPADQVRASHPAAALEQCAPRGASGTRARRRAAVLMAVLAVGGIIGLASQLARRAPQAPPPALPLAQALGPSAAGGRAREAAEHLRAPAIENAADAAPDGPLSTPKAPFGLHAGMSIDALAAAGEPLGGGEYLLHSVPAPGDPFLRYTAHAAADTGLCRLTAQTGPIGVDRSGAALRARFTAMQARLARIYGVYRHGDIALSEPAFTSGDDWLRGLAAGERYLFSVWHALTGAALPPDLSTVVLRAAAPDGAAGHLELEVRFANATACEAASSSAPAAP
jgi:hypothetical protein